MASEPLDLPAEQCPVSQGHKDESSFDEDEASHSSEENQKENDEYLALKRQQAAARWGFDFKAGRPLPGPWNWEAVPSCSIPSFYHSRCISPPYVNGLLIVDN